jgi:hypothetical protein
MTMTPSPVPPAQPTGRVVTVTDAQGQNSQGQWVKGRQVTYQLVSGQTGTVFVPGAEFSVDAVRAAIQADASKLADVVNLTF